MAQHGALRVLIAEDDPLQRTALRDWIRELQPSWHVVADVGSVDEVHAGLDAHAPDLALIDIHLPGAASAEWVKSLDATTPVIYVTGDPDLAVHAFESAAIDYVLKPVTMRRLKSALERAAVHLRRAHGSPADAGLAPPSSNGEFQWLLMSRGHELVVVQPEDVLFFEADMKYTRVVARQGEGLVRAGLNELCERFPSQQFVKIHRGTVVNLRHIASVTRCELGHLEVRMQGRSEVLRVSKSFQHVFRLF